jgi:hypothetical protein
MKHSFYDDMIDAAKQAQVVDKPNPSHVQPQITTQQRVDDHMKKEFPGYYGYATRKSE